MPDSLEAGDAKPDSARPSFTGYWKRSKDEQATQNLTFVSSKLGQQPSAQVENEDQTEPFADAKAKARRQQVRNAQRQHRLRKANYTKQLEMDITKLRDDIAKVEQELETLRSQNGAIRSQLACGASGGEEQQQQQHQPPAAVAAVTGAAPLGMPSSSPVDMTMTMADMAFSTSLAPHYIVSLDMAESLGTPAFYVSRSSPSLHGSSSSSSGGKATATETMSSATPASTVGTSLDDVAIMETTLSEEQIDQAINFILALEHCCWNHVDKSCFEHHHHHHHHQQQDVHAACPGERLNGHTLMATTLALQGAPSAVFTRMNDLQQQMNNASTTTTTTTTTTTNISPSPSLSPATITTTAPTTGEGGRGRGGGQLAWPSRALTLTNLRRLAGTLNASAAELAPVQAWFELASLYGVAVATDGAVLERVKRELAGEVRCVMFGAAVQRDVFEAVLKRVIGFLPRTRSPRPPRLQLEGGEEGEEREEQEGMMMGMGMGMDMGMSMGYEEGDEEGMEEIMEDMMGMGMGMEDMTGMGMGMDMGMDEMGMNVGSQVSKGVN
ncbi:hypothetical protein F5Y09DRAFT_341497 [Xylaria sp. FL1042]|nr:hypothetical protein F5Y09DRAFT_341497 [Xylaria sp. FL1042]